MPVRRLAGGVLLALYTAAAAALVHAAPDFWEMATQADFLRGEVDQLSIDEHGRVTLGPRLDRVHDTALPFVWAVSPAPDGGFFLGTGNEGRVIRVDADGTAHTYFDASEMEVHALAPAPDGGLYVATSPDGRIYKVDRAGRGAPFFDPDDKYIWALAAASDGTLFAATGDKGLVYRITADGKGTPFFSTKATHATALAVDASERLLVGTGSPGRVFRVDESGKGFLLLDTSYQEVRALRVADDGGVYVAAQSAGAAPARSTNTPPAPEVVRPSAGATVSTEITSIRVVDVAVVTPETSSTPAPSPPAASASGAIYRILPDGLWDQVWASTMDAPYDLLVRPDGLLVATGGDGKVFRLSGEPIHATLVARAPAQQVTRLAASDEKTWMITSNPGLLLALSNTPSESGTYESEVRDARMVSRWGTLSWRATTPAGARVVLSTRSGNTQVPDETWSDWSEPYASAEGSAITSPGARYLQWRAVLSGKKASPVLTSVRVAYLQRNVRPAVRSITVHPAGTVFQKPFSTGEAEIAGLEGAPNVEIRRPEDGDSSGAPSLGRRVYQRGLRTFVWRADDANGDDLVYAVLYRREGETAWKPLRSNLTEALTVWDTSSAPDGTYILKVVASDRVSNPAETALAGELVSESFDIDNSPPDVTLSAGRGDKGRPAVEVTVADGQSAVAQVEFSVDAGRWQTVFPPDGMLDAREERLTIPLDASASGRTVVVRATDAMGNHGHGQVVVP